MQVDKKKGRKVKQLTGRLVMREEPTGGKTTRRKEAIRLVMREEPTGGKTTRRKGAIGGCPC